MKNKLLILLFAVLLALTGCQEEEDVKEPSAEQKIASEGNEEEMAEDLEEVLGDYIIEPNDALKTVFSKSWDVTGTSETYVLEMDGTGMKNEESLTYECGFDEENQIILSFHIEGKASKESYIAVSDATGYGLDLTPIDGGETINLFPSNMELLAVSDERVTGLTGTWKDDNKNEYIFKEDGSLFIKGKESDTPGTWCAIEKEEEGVFIVNLLVEGGSLEFEYEIQEEGQTLALYNRGAETWYYWYK